VVSKCLSNESSSNQLRNGVEVCYARGWGGATVGKWAEYDKNYLSPSVSIVQIV
jgi:hypothetical protein